MTTEQRQQAALTRRRYDSLTHPYQGSVASLISELRPAYPVNVVRPEKVAANVRRFLNEFPGQTMYAVKCNPEKVILQTMIKAGLHNFDCASIDEIRTIRKLAPKAKIYFMHPVKGREAIREAYYTHGVRAFVLDCIDELHKILQETDLAPDLELFVRIAMPKSSVTNPSLALTGKFGAAPDEAAMLLQHCRPVSTKLGISFHVGSQCMKPERFAKAIHISDSVIKASGVKVDVLDVGGGFPVEYPNYQPAPFETYLDAISTAMSKHRRLTGIELLCEPGRALVASAGSLIVRIEQRKGDLLYLNDGTYGSLFDAGGQSGGIFATALHRINTAPSANDAPFRFAGPTCDSIDMMNGPFMLPQDTGEGDWIEIQGVGAYCANMQTRFNGFGQTSLVVLKDQKAGSNVIRM